jgi:hypothetical protein
MDRTGFRILNFIALTFKYFRKRSTSFISFSTDAENGK